MLGSTNSVALLLESLKISLNGVEKVSYSGIDAASINITAASIGAAASSHTHSYAGSSSAGGAANSAVKLATARKIGSATFDGTANITLAQIGAAAASHTHTKSQITDFPATLKNPTSVIIKFNGGTTEGTNLFTYDGSTAKTLNITAASIGAAAASHSHAYAGSSSAGGAANSAVKLATARKIGNANFDGTADITLAAIGAAAANHTHTGLNGLAQHITLGDGSSGSIIQNSGTYQQRFYISDSAENDDAVFTFSQSSDSGETWINLFNILDNGTVQALNFDGLASSATKLATARKIGNANFDGTTDITLANIGAAAASHTHTKSQITDFPATLKNPTAITIKLNSGTTEGTNLFTYDGSNGKSINITAATIGAAAASHTHSYAGSSSAGGAATSAVKLATARKIGSASFDGTADITVASIGAAAASHTHNYAGSSAAGGAANSAVKLATARKIGNANFDGTANVTLDQIGAAAAPLVYKAIAIAVASWNTTTKIFEHANAAITVNHSPDVRFAENSIAAASKSGIIVYTEAGKLVFKCLNDIPTVALTVDVAILTPV